MSYYKANKISFRYPSRIENIFQDISFHIGPESRIGLIGNNGTGKSTLLGIILNNLIPTEGSISKKNNIIIGYLPQELSICNEEIISDFLWKSNEELYILKKKMDSPNQVDLNIYSDFDDLGGYSFEARIEKTIMQFGFHLEILNMPVSALSAGQKTKLAICRIILKDPDLILLDEPTNHLDIDTLQWLEEYLPAINIPYLIISHDRQFLDNCINEIWELSNCRLNTFSGNYSFYKREIEDKFNREIHNYEKQQKKIRQLKQVLSDRKGKAMSMENFKAERSIKKNGGICKRDDGSGKGVKVKKAMKSAMAINSRIERIITKEEAKRPFIEKKRSLIIQDTNLRNKCILNITNLCKSFGDNQVLNNISFSMEKTTKLAITGKNGSGKSTLLKILSGHINSYTGNIQWAPKTKKGYYAQEFENLNLSNTILEEVIQGKYNNESFARTILGSLNITKDRVYQEISTLSIGERSKVSLAKIIYSEPNVLLLDEPTNHLEIKARESFENALKNYTGALIFVSHDRYFVKAIANKIIEL